MNPKRKKFLSFMTFISWFITNVNSINCQSGQIESQPSEKKQSISAQQFQSNQTRISNEYIVTLTGTGNIEDIKQALGQFEITEISDMGNNSYLIKIKKDPGPEIIAKTAEGKKGVKYIQPNFVYKAF